MSHVDQIPFLIVWMPRICAHLQEVPATKQLAGKKESNQSKSLQSHEIGQQITSKPNESVNQDQKTENKPQEWKDWKNLEIETQLY